MTGFVYIMTNKPRGTLYIGVTNNLERRIHEHKSGDIAGFTSRYQLDKLVWYEEFHNIADAIIREKQMKEWPRRWKINAIVTMNADWTDLAGSWYNPWTPAYAGVAN
jgi:putative endonuclease